MTYKVGDLVRFKKPGYPSFNGGIYRITEIRSDGWHAFTLEKSLNSSYKAERFGLTSSDLNEYVESYKYIRTRKGFAKFSHEHYPLTKAS